MKIGLIARADTRGLGIQTKAFYDNMNPAKTMVINCSSAKPLPIRHDWYQDATWINGLPTARDFANWLPGLDAVYTAETPYDHSLFSEADRLGVRTVLHVNPEFLDHIRRPHMPRPSVFACPTRWMWDRIPDPKVDLPVPIDVNKFASDKPDLATSFLHVIGRPAIHDRNGTADLLLALESVTSNIRVTITCQEAGYVDELIATNDIRIPMHVRLSIVTSDVDNNWELYEGHHALLAPRRFGGLCLPMREAVAAGMPVIATAVSPNTDWLPADWLVPARKTGSFVAHTEVDLHTVSHYELADKIDLYAQDTAAYTQAVATAQSMAAGMSWDALRETYTTVLGAAA